MNWVSVAVRAVLDCCFIPPRLSSPRVSIYFTHLLITGLFGFLSTMAETAFLADQPRKESTLLLVISAATIYLYSLLVIGQRPPLVGTLLAAGLVTVFSYVVEKRFLEMEAVPEEMSPVEPAPEENQG